MRPELNQRIKLLFLTVLFFGSTACFAVPFFQGSYHLLSFESRIDQATVSNLSAPSFGIGFRGNTETWKNWGVLIGYQAYHWQDSKALSKVNARRLSLGSVYWRKYFTLSAGFAQLQRTTSLEASFVYRDLDSNTEGFFIEFAPKLYIGSGFEFFVGGHADYYFEGTAAYALFTGIRLFFNDLPCGTSSSYCE